MRIPMIRWTSGARIYGYVVHSKQYAYGLIRLMGTRGVSSSSFCYGQRWALAENSSAGTRFAVTNVGGDTQSFPAVGLQIGLDRDGFRAGCRLRPRLEPLHRHRLTREAQEMLRHLVRPLGVVVAVCTLTVGVSAPAGASTIAARPSLTGPASPSRRVVPTTSSGPAPIPTASFISPPSIC